MPRVRTFYGPRVGGWTDDAATLVQALPEAPLDLKAGGWVAMLIAGQEPRHPQDRVEARRASQRKANQRYKARKKARATAAVARAKARHAEQKKEWARKQRAEAPGRLTAGWLRAFLANAPEPVTAAEIRAVSRCPSNQPGAHMARLVKQGFAVLVDTGPNRWKATS